MSDVIDALGGDISEARCPGMARRAGRDALAWAVMLVVLLALVCCSGSGSPDATLAPVSPASARVDASTNLPDGAVTSDGGVDAAPDGPQVLGGLLRIMAANISSGASLDYGPVEGVRIFKGMHPDIVLIQELNVGGGSKPEIDSFVATTFGAAFAYYREPLAQIPNGIISRYRIVESGTWVDPVVVNRGFAYAKIQIPGPHPLWAVSIHLLTTGSAQRSLEVAELVKRVKAAVPTEDYLVVGGDFNTGGRDEDCVVNVATGLPAIAVTSAPYPTDGEGNGNTSARRTKPYDWLVANAKLSSAGVPMVVGQRAFPAGLVFDSRTFTPLADVAPVQVTDSAARNMQHMPVVRDFLVPL